MLKKNHTRTAWLIMIVLLAFSVAAPLNQFKVPPIMPLLMRAFQLDVGSAGSLMSVFAITGLILALPAGFIYQRLGFRITGLLAVGSVLLGAILGAISHSIEALLVSRVIEGVGTSLTAVVAPAVIAMWFPAEERGTPLGLWATWVPLGSTIMLVLAPALAGPSNWRAVWWFGAVFAGLVGALYILFVKKPAPLSVDSKNNARATRVTTVDLGRVLRNRDLWLISLLFCAFDVVLIGFVTWAPTFLNTARGTLLGYAAFLTSLVMMLNIISCPLSGWISDWIGSRRVITVIPMILIGLMWPLADQLDGDRFLGLMVALGFVSGFVPTGVFAAAVEAVGDERLGGMAMAVVQVGQNAGMLLGPLLVGWIVAATGNWAMAFWALVPVTVLGILAGLIAHMR